MSLTSHIYICMLPMSSRIDLHGMYVFLSLVAAVVGGLGTGRGRVLGSMAWLSAYLPLRFQDDWSHFRKCWAEYVVELLSLAVLGDKVKTDCGRRMHTYEVGMRWTTTHHTFNRQLYYTFVIQTLLRISMASLTYCWVFFFNNSDSSVGVASALWCKVRVQLLIR